MANPLPRLLVFNCHEAWVHQLEYLGYHLDIVDGLPGRYCSSWDTGIRPVPRSACLVNLKEVIENRTSYHSLIGHNITDILDLKMIPGPRILVFHNTLDGLIRQHGLDMPPEKLKDLIRSYLGKIGGHSIAISPLKVKSWGIPADIVQNGVDVRQYLPWSGSVAAGLRVSNQISNRKEILFWDFHEAAFSSLPVRLVGFNPDRVGVEPSKGWSDLKLILSSYRFYIHTAHTELEDGYNMATLEAMAAGLPVLGNHHPSSPVEHGVSGFLSDDPGELGRYAQLLLRDRDLAGRMGEAAKRKVAQDFSIERFVRKFEGSIEQARKKWEFRTLPETYFSRGTHEGIEAAELLVRSGRFFHLCQTLGNHLISLEIEAAVAVLDKMMRVLDMNSEVCISSFADLSHVIAEVSDRLIALGDHQSARVLLNAARNVLLPRRL
jgi:Glycosyl transferases group 1